MPAYAAFHIGHSQSGRAVSGNFNPYRDWMELDGEPTTPDYYQLFGLPQFESDGEKIATAAARAATKVRSCRPGEHAKEWASLLDEISAAQKTLTDPAARAAYDQQLKSNPAAVAPPASTPAAGASTSGASTSDASTSGASTSGASTSGAAKFDPMLPPGTGGNSNAPTAAEAQQATDNSPETPSSILPKGLSDSVTAGYAPPNPGYAPPSAGAKSDAGGGQSPMSPPAANPAPMAPANPAAMDPMTPTPMDPTPMDPMNPAPMAPANPAAFAPSDTAPQFTPAPPTAGVADPMAPSGLTPLPPQDNASQNNPPQAGAAPTAGLTPLAPMGAKTVTNEAMDAALNILSLPNQPAAQQGAPMSPMQPAGQAPAGQAPMGQAPMGQAPMGQPPMGQPVGQPAANGYGQSATPAYGQPAMAQPVNQNNAPSQAKPAAGPPAPVVKGHATPSQIAAARRKQGLVAFVAGLVGLLLVGGVGAGVFYYLNGAGGLAADGIAADGGTPAADSSIQADSRPSADGSVVPPQSDAAPADAGPAGPDGGVSDSKTPAGDASTPPADGAPADGNAPAADGTPPAADSSVATDDDGAAPPPADGSMADGAPQPEPVKPEPKKPEPNKPEPKKPEPPAKPTRAELQKLSELLTGTRTALGQRDFKTAGQQLGEAIKLAKLPKHKEMVDRLQTLSSYATKFWRAVVTALGNLESASIIEVGGTQVAVVESSPQRIVVRYNGRRMEWSAAQIPGGFALPITAYGLPENGPENPAIQAAIYLVDPDKKKWEKARPLLIRANANGVKDAGVLLKTITDDYSTIVKDAE